MKRVNHLLEQNRRYRNRRIGESLKELHLTEGRNTGFRKILRALERNGSPQPEFETDDDRSYFITRLFIHESFKEYPVEQAVYETSDKVAEHKRRIVAFFAERESAQAGAIADAIGLSAARTHAIPSEMVAEGAVEARGERRARRYELPR